MTLPPPTPVICCTSLFLSQMQLETWVGRAGTLLPKLDAASELNFLGLNKGQNCSRVWGTGCQLWATGNEQWVWQCTFTMAREGGPNQTPRSEDPAAPRSGSRYCAREGLGYGCEGWEAGNLLYGGHFCILVKNLFLPWSPCFLSSVKSHPLIYCCLGAWHFICWGLHQLWACSSFKE